MISYTIDKTLNITAHLGEPPVEVDTQRFTSETELAGLTAEWTASKLVDTWNSFAGVAPFGDVQAVKRFTDRKSAVARIWKGVQRLSQFATTEQAREALPTAPAVDEPTALDQPHTTREGSKKEAVLGLLRRTAGASMAEIMTATGWQAHTVRGFISGTLT